MEETIILFLLLIISLHNQPTLAAELTAISDSKFLTENDTLVSPAGLLELGFFRPPGTSGNRYVGIWYKKIPVQTVVWVANRNTPLSGESLFTLKIVKTGDLVLVNDTNDVVWSTNVTSSFSGVKTTADLDDAGNLVVRTKDRILWQSFDFPTDTLLPGMKFGRDFVTGKEWSLSSWKSNEDPAPGDLTWTIDTRGYPQNLLKESESIKFRGGPWNGVRFSGASGFGGSTIINTEYVINEREVAFTYSLQNNSVESRFVLNSSGHMERYVWVSEAKKWQLILQLPKDICDTYNICSAYGSCSILTSQKCECLDGLRFVPRNKKGWEVADWLGGCVRRKPLDCERGGVDGFVKYSSVKLPDTRRSWFDMRMSLKECEEKCLKNCSCMAYANTDIRGKGSGCLMFFGELMDIRVYSEGNGGQDLFIRMASSELAAQTVIKEKGRSKLKTIIPAVCLGVVICLSAAWFWYVCKKRHHAKPKKEGEFSHGGESQGSMELPLFSFSTIAKATDSFSHENKLGEGGFGPVYKGVLEEGQEVAVKRLSKYSSQGLDEFKNEVICISKLQHRNLVRLLGCSIDGDEKLLIYEYMPNRSLDWFIFDKTRCALLDWSMRFNIIKGIARGLLYLHQDSRLRIIHRDLKASNVLLDQDMNPKISDFGIARSFGGNETQANTERVVGTYGYMSPEYALDGRFSTKSDVFSFGVLVLEIVSGKRNRGFVHPEHDNNLIGHAWRLHNEGRTMELVDQILSEPSDPSEVLRSVQLGLLCVQQSPDDRPEMSSVVLMLSNEGAMLKPKQPAFFAERNFIGPDFSSSTYPTSSTNDVTVTEIVAR